MTGQKRHAIKSLLLIVGLFLAVSLLAACEQEKPTTKDAAPCAKCGLVKGSPACCNLDALCPKCGQVKGTEACCDATAAKCDKCSLAKGSPGCCKLPK